MLVFVRSLIFSIVDGWMPIRDIALPLKSTYERRILTPRPWGLVMRVAANTNDECSEIIIRGLVGMEWLLEFEWVGWDEYWSSGVWRCSRKLPGIYLSFWLGECFEKND